MSPASSEETTAFSIIDVTDDQEASIVFAPATDTINDPEASLELAPATETSPKMALKPLKPIMGDLIQVSATEWTAWTGGKPNSSWTILDGATTTYGSPNQLRPNSASYAQRGFQYRSTGIEDKFKRSDDLATFIREVSEHLIDTGMDSISYLPSPTDATKMCSVLTEYSKYSADTARSSGATFAALYDTYDKINDKAASKYLLNSLDKDLRETLHLRLEPMDTFHVLWLELIKAVRSTSIDRFDDLKAKLRTRKATDYAGQNVDKLSKAYKKDATELTSAGQYEHNLTLHMLKVFLEAGGRSNESYRFELRLMKRSLDAELLTVAHMSRDDADKYMATKSLTYKHICIKAEDEYHKQRDNNEWPPARHATDSRAPPGNFGANANVCMTPGASLTEAQVNMLIQRQMKDSTGPSSGTRGNCHNCGQPGHFARNCPKQQGRGQPQGRTGGRGGRGSGNPRDRGSSDRQKPPGPNDTPSGNLNGFPIFRKQFEGKAFTFCQKCGSTGRWSTTHSTGGHTGPVRSENKHSTPSNATPSSAHFSLVPDPSAWHISFTWETFLYDLWCLLAPYLWSGLLGSAAIYALYCIGWSVCSCTSVVGSHLTVIRNAAQRRSALSADVPKNTILFTKIYLLSLLLVSTRCRIPSTALPRKSSSSRNLTNSVVLRTTPSANVLNQDRPSLVLLALSEEITIQCLLNTAQPRCTVLEEKAPQFPRQVLLFSLRQNPKLLVPPRPQLATALLKLQIKTKIHL